jgi:hypothetical protein
MEGLLSLHANLWAALATGRRDRGMMDRRHAMTSLLAIAFAAVVVVTGCSRTTASTAQAVNARNPESVLRAYFAAWQRGDWARQESFMDAKYAGGIPEPVTSLRILTLRRVAKARTRYLYAVSFDIVAKGSGVSMTSGRYDWTYELAWDAARRSWIITNYGAG